MLRNAVGLVMAVAFLVASASASATTISFVGPGTDWNSAANWSPAQVPTSSDDVVINTGAPVISAAAAAAHSVSINTGAPGGASLTVQNAQTLTVGAGTSTISNLTIFAGATVTLGGATSWSAGFFQMQSSTLNLNAAFSIAGDLNVTDFGGNQVTSPPPAA